MSDKDHKSPASTNNKQHEHTTTERFIRKDSPRPLNEETKSYSSPAPRDLPLESKPTKK